MGWSAFFDGETLGQRGSEGGVILLDEEQEGGARITLEQRGRHAPFAITCGVYGLLVHTRYFSTERAARRALDEMKPAIEDLLRHPEPGQAAGDFIDRFPTLELPQEPC